MLIRLFRLLCSKNARTQSYPKLRIRAHYLLLPSTLAHISILYRRRRTEHLSNDKSLRFRCRVACGLRLYLYYSIFCIICQGTMWIIFSHSRKKRSPPPTSAVGEIILSNQLRESIYNSSLFTDRLQIIHPTFRDKIP